MNNFIVTGFYTKSPYDRGAACLAKSCELAGIEHDIRNYKHPEEKDTSEACFQKIMRLKINVIRNVMELHNKPVLYVDCDAYIKDGEAVKKLLNSSRFRNIDCAWNMFEDGSPNTPKKRFNYMTHWPAGGALFFNNTIGGRKILDAWDKEFDLNTNFDLYCDQIRLYDAWKKTPDITYYNLPKSWYVMWGESDDVVISQMQLRRLPGVVDQVERMLWKDSSDINYDYIYNQAYIGGYHKGPDTTNAREVVPYILDNLDFDSILDVGCAKGWAVYQLTKVGKKSQGIEITRLGVESAKQLGRNVKQGNILNMYNIKDNSFDVTMTTDVLEHLHIDDIDKAIKNLIRVSSKYTVHRIATWAGNTNNWKDFKHLIPDPHLTVRDLNWWEDKFKQHGCKLIKRLDDINTLIFEV